MWRAARTVLGIILVIIGIIWILQGANAFGMTGGMNGQHIWIVIGAVVVAAGLALLSALARRGPRPQ